MTEMSERNVEVCQCLLPDIILDRSLSIIIHTVPPVELIMWIVWRTLH